MPIFGPGGGGKVLDHPVFQESINHLAVAFLEIAVWGGQSFELPCSIILIKILQKVTLSVRLNLF